MRKPLDYILPIATLWAVLVLAMIFFDDTASDRWRTATMAVVFSLSVSIGVFFRRRREARRAAPSASR